MLSVLGVKIEKNVGLCGVIPPNCNNIPKKLSNMPNLSQGVR